MGEIINLKRARKAQARAADEKRAADNRAKFGRTRAEKATARAEAERITRQHDGMRLPTTEPGDD